MRDKSREIGEKEKEPKQDQNNIVSKLRHMENEGHEEKRLATV